MKKIVFSLVEILVMVVVIYIGIVIVTTNHYKAIYQKEEPVSYQEAKDCYETMAGYPAGDDIPVAKTIEDINCEAYCTIEVSRENLEPLHYFYIKNSNFAHKF